MDSNFQYASTVRWHRATDLPLPPPVKRRSAGRPPPMARPRSEAQRDPSQGVHAGTARLDFDLADIAKLVHGTTVATTTIIERRARAPRC